MIENVNYRKVNRKRKRPKVKKYVKSEAKRLNSGNLKRGLVVYEVLMLENPEYRDSYTLIEENIDREIADHLVGTDTAQVRKSLQKVIVAGSENGREKLIQKCDAENPQEEIGEMSFELPVDMETPYGFNKDVEDAFVSYVENAFDDRLDRIQCKQDLLQYLKYNEETEHEVAKAIVQNKDGLFHVQGVRDVLGLDDSEGNWWESDDLTLDELQELEHTENGDGLTQEQKQERIEALQTALENDGSVTSEDEVRQIVKNVYDVKSDVTIDSYVDGIDLHWVDTLMAHHTNPLKLAQDELYENAKHGKKHRFSGELSELFCVPEKLLESGEMRAERAYVLADELQHRIDLNHDIGAKNQILSDIKESLENQKQLCRKVADNWDDGEVEEIRAEIDVDTEEEQEEQNSTENLEQEVKQKMEGMLN